MMHVIDSLSLIESNKIAWFSLLGKAMQQAVIFWV